MLIRYAKLRRIARIITAFAVGALALVAALRALVALVEALSVLILALILASITLPHGIAYYWRKVRIALPGLLESLAGSLRPPAQQAASEPSSSDSTASEDAQQNESSAGSKGTVQPQ